MISILFRELSASILKADEYLHGLTTHKTAKLGTDNNIYIYIYRVSQEECARLRESVP